jgi:hypothetical protein
MNHKERCDNARDCEARRVKLVETKPEVIGRTAVLDWFATPPYRPNPVPQTHPQHHQEAEQEHAVGAPVAECDSERECN